MGETIPRHLREVLGHPFCAGAYSNDICGELGGVRCACTHI